jgi:hypothetical protein
MSSIRKSILSTISFTIRFLNEVRLFIVFSDYLVLML